MKVYVVVGYNGLLKVYGVVGVASSLEKAKQIEKEHEYMLDESKIFEQTVED